jgi:hypothetical protein
MTRQVAQRFRTVLRINFQPNMPISPASTLEVGASICECTRWARYVTPASAYFADTIQTSPNVRDVPKSEVS